MKYLKYIILITVTSLTFILYCMYYDSSFFITDKKIDILFYKSDKDRAIIELSDSLIVDVLKHEDMVSFSFMKNEETKKYPYGKPLLLVNFTGINNEDVEKMQVARYLFEDGNNVIIDYDNQGEISRKKQVLPGEIKVLYEKNETPIRPK